MTNMLADFNFNKKMYKTESEEKQTSDSSLVSERVFVDEDALKELIQKYVLSSKYRSPELRGHKYVGTKAQVCYDECVDLFGWSVNQRGNFAPQHILYAQNATEEGYSVWFLTHNNFTETTGKKWFNQVSDGEVQEIWNTVDSRFYGDRSIRVTFIKKKDGYYFWGLFIPVRVEEYEENGNTVYKKIYKKISSVYPS